MSERKYPVGIQTFSEIINGGYIYIDKTALIYNLVKNNSYVFLNRPRRFGKSLLVSTMEEYFSGNKELFKGLKIEKLEKDWISYPVLHFDLSTIKEHTCEALRNGLDFKLKPYEKLYNVPKEENLSDRLTSIIEHAYNQTGKKVVILIDEYDSPLLNVLYEDVMKQFREIMRSFYSPIKNCDRYIHFAFMTGITKFSQLSIFSELNNLNIISMNDDACALCGITQEELDTQMKDDIQILADKNDITFDEARATLKKMYDGYHFSKRSMDIYNPFSLLKCFKNGEFENFWFESATPGFLLDTMKRFKFNLTKTENLECGAGSFDISANDLNSAIPLMYQAGYLTIKDFEKETKLYTLGIPNNEVRYGLCESLYATMFPIDEGDSTFWIGKFRRAVLDGDIEKFMTLLISLLKSMPYATGKDAEKVIEQSIQNAFFIIFNLLGQFTLTECHTLKGRSDCEVVTNDFVYLLEFKVDGSSVDDALKQIDSQDYACKYEPSGKKVVKVGVAFDVKEKEFEWKFA